MHRTRTSRIRADPPATARVARRMLALLALTSAADMNSLVAQMPPGVERDPAAARIETADLDRFAAVFRRLPAVHDTAALLDSAYLSAATVGLATYARMYGVDAAAVASAMHRAPDAFRRAALRYAQETSSDRALAALLRVDDYEVFLRESGYEAFLETREGRRFADC